MKTWTSHAAAASQEHEQLQESVGSREKNSCGGRQKEKKEDMSQERKAAAIKQLSVPTMLDCSEKSTKKFFHQEPAGECLVCFDSLEPHNYAEYALHTHSCCSQQQEEDRIPTETAKGGPNLAAAVMNSKITGAPVSSTASQREVQEKCESSPDATETTWHPAKFCTGCIEELRAMQFKRYCDSVANSTCAREQRALLERGPPINLRDRLAFPESNDQEISSLWYAADKQVRPAKLKDSLEGEERQKLWSRLQQFLIENEEIPDESNGKRTENL